MKKETLKELIEMEFERCETISQFKKEVFRLIDLYDNDKDVNITFHPSQIDYEEPDEIPYGELCSCNPKNGGSGICGCVLGNTMVKNPRKLGGSTGSRTITNFNYPEDL